MIQKAKGILFFSLLLFCMCWLSGCAIDYGANRYYSGPPLPKNEVALVYAFAGCKMVDVHREPEKETRHFNLLKDAPLRMLDLVPGEYIIGITYSHSASDIEKRTLTLGDKVRLKLRTRPGGVYIIYPSFEEGKWRPVFVAIDDYDINECKKHNIHSSCPRKEMIDKTTAQYLNSERPVMKFHPLSETPYLKPVTEEAKREIKGFWW